MRKLAALLAALAMVLGVAGIALAADGGSGGDATILIAVNDDIDVAAGEQVDAVIVISGNARIAGTVTALFVVDGVASTAPGSSFDTITVINSTADLATGTTVRGDISQLQATVNRADGVTVGGSVRDVAGDAAAFGLFMGAAAILLWIGFALVTIVVGLLLAGLAARQVRQATTLISREPLKTFLVGLLVVVVVPILTIAAFVTVVGIPAAITIALVVIPAGAFIGYMVAAIWIGEWLLARRNVAGPPPERPYLAAVVGLVVAFILGFIPLITSIISIFGIGAVVIAAWRTLRGSPAPETTRISGWHQPTPAM
jgi:hypothetical protein